ncbi:Cytochrome c, mono-and diheme variants family [Croceitalea dokdonensis DOKDO 023]|uniref:Cytochrome c, mono-and diheme variants family n=1 Tax=Croceitalea dokdonensis DOKDO 023 TaxID=1300341 RepID=A0A0N8H4C1_9FLAO|nr:hypothetical protein [Croceitalea dokdonensis]KPM32956.1 Cytochrome c, mono-and diheme variants family [Croceitalea dokdonensis DOKDO 023]
MKELKHLLFILLLIICSGCLEKKIPPIKKIAINDPFKATMVKSQYFQISGEKDNIIEGKEGTLLILPNGSLITAKGNKANGDITIELAEGLTLNTMILSNLTTTSRGKLLETGGMIYLNATSDGEQLQINPEKPIYIEIPTNRVEPDMMVYQGIRDSMGNMDWVKPKPLSNSLIPVDIFSLDFLPNGFREEVEKGLPFGTFEKPTDEIVDSLYYFQDVYMQNLVSQLNAINRLTNESSKDIFLNANQVNSFNDEERNTKDLDTISSSPKTEYGINPLKIKAIKSDGFQNTLIATREFQRRLKVMFKICRPDVLDIYIDNLDENMWELDRLVAEVLVDNRYQDDFLSFQKEKKTKVAGTSINSELLKKHYTKKMDEAKRDRERLSKKLTEIRKIEEQQLDSLKKEYQKVLNKRKRYRMQSYGFEQTQMGWINIDRGTEVKDWNYQSLELTVQEGANYDKIFSYIFYKSTNSLYRLNSADNITFYAGDAPAGSMPMPKHKPAVAVVVGYRGNKNFLAIKEFETTTLKNLNIRLKETTVEELNQKLSEFEINGSENSIKVDLNDINQIAPSKKEKQNLDDSYKFLKLLREKSFPSDSSFMRFDRVYQIELQVDTCVSNVRIKDEIMETLPEQVPML